MMRNKSWEYREGSIINHIEILAVKNYIVMSYSAKFACPAMPGYSIKNARDSNSNRKRFRTIAKSNASRAKKVMPAMQDGPV